MRYIEPVRVLTFVNFESYC